MLIAFSGIDGCGKGTQKELLADYLRNRGKRVFMSKAYGDAEKESFSPFINSWSQESILFLFQALHTEQRARAQAALMLGEIVIADRWDESYLAYHALHGILAADDDLRKKLNLIAFRGIVPDITFLLDLSVGLARRRVESRGMDFFDRLSAEYHQAMRMEYLRLATERGWRVLNGAEAPGNIHKTVVRAVGNLVSL